MGKGTEGVFVLFELLLGGFAPRAKGIASRQHAHLALAGAG